MRYRLTVLSLAALLGVLPELTTVPAAPAPNTPKMPEIYALVYVGLGKNDPDNAKRIDVAIQELRGSGARGAVRDPKVKALPIVQDKEKKLGWIERDKWAESKTRAASVEGTAVLRVWFTEGSPEEQVIIINAIVLDYVKDQQEFCRNALKRAEIHEREVRAMKQHEGMEWTKEDERICRSQEEAFKHPPHVLEWATPPEKP
jgi:hypothetical protein